METEDSTKRETLKRLRLDLDACGGRGVELAEDIDQLACELGDCVYDAETCGWKSRASHSLSDIHGGMWGEHDYYPVEDWVMDATNGDTRLGYWEWLSDMLETKEDPDPAVLE